MVQEHGPMDEFKQIFDQVPDDRLGYTDLGSTTLLYRYEGVIYSVYTVNFHSMAKDCKQKFWRNYL